MIEAIQELNNKGIQNKEIGVTSFYFDTGLGDMELVNSADDFIKRLDITKRCWEEEIKAALNE